MDIIILLKNFFLSFYLPIGRMLFGKNFDLSISTPLFRKVGVGLICFSILVSLILIGMMLYCNSFQCELGGSLASFFK